jgi:hypothetical protein
MHPTQLIQAWPTITYSQAVQSIAATATIKDGCNGHTCKVGIGLVDNVAIAVYTGSMSGFIRLSARQYQDMVEVLYYANWKASELGSRVISIDPVIDQEFVDSLPVG